MTNKLALVTGSFDPITNGHVDIVRRAALLFDRVIVLVADNVEKQYMFSPNQRVAIAKAAVEDLPNVAVEPWGGYVADFAKAQGAVAFVRGIRGIEDVAYEQYMAEKNFALCGVDTVLLFANPAYQTLSSTAVRRALQEGNATEEMMSPKSMRIAYTILKNKREA